MNELGKFFIHGSPNIVGEFLREITFVKHHEDDFGCYSAFDVREDAREWNYDERYSFWYSQYGDVPQSVMSDEEVDGIANDNAEMGKGYSFNFMGFGIDCCWYWDGDGTLSYRISDYEQGIIRAVENTDCKKNYVWENS